MKQELVMKQNITFIEVKDKSIIPILRQRIKDEQSLEGLNIGKVFNKQNIIVDAGLSVVMALLAGDNTNTLEINYGALGTGSVAPSGSDTQMEAEVYRKLASSASYDGKKTYIDFFYEKEDVSGDFTKFANFIDGTASADTGIMWSHITVDWSKTSNEGLFIACQYTISYKS